MASSQPTGDGLLGQIVEHLKGHPALLYGIGAGLLVLSLGSVAAGQPLLAVLLVVVLLAGLVAWVVDSRSARATDVALQPRPPSMEADVEVGQRFAAGDDARLGSADGPATGTFAPKVKIGDGATFGNRASIGSSGTGPAPGRDAAEAAEETDPSSPAG
jgi:hypothetical protein